MDIAARYETSASERDLHRIGTALRRTMEHRLDVVAIGVEHKRSVIARVIRAHARRAVVAAAMGEGGLMERMHHGHVMRLEGQMVAAGEFALRHRVAIGHEQLVGPEESLTFATDGNAQGIEHRLVETSARRQVADDQMQVIDQAAA
ncbi:hypothetical protein FHT09_000662 [Xanthomonas arboricola]|nr:hypothetical protein [Xanthomonas sp. CFBP 8152]